jgi:Domain of unknown function (DUF4173)
MSGMRFSQPSFPARFGIAAANVAAADFLLYGQPWALSLTVLFGLVGVSVLGSHTALFARSGWLAKVALLVAALLPLVENVSLLSTCVALALLAVLALTAGGRLDPFGGDSGRLGRALLAFGVLAPFRLIGDTFRWRRVAKRLGRRGLRFAALAAWIMPLVLGAVFLTLFGQANPIIQHWLSLIDIQTLLDLIEPVRVIFWLLLLVAVWAFLRPRPPWFFRGPFGVLAPLDTLRTGSPAAGPGPASATKPSAARSFEGAVFAKAAILRALILFNLMFAVETALDATYLWGGAALPDGLSYADYAHGSAYPLIATALLAALFVLLALRPGSATSRDRLIRVLVYVWVGQNILLVISSIFRLDLYVGIYALTYWRVAAFVWMGLVAVGLALIIARIALAKSNKWLFSANLWALSATLYACCFVNFAALIARYNVEHSYEMTGQGVAIDIGYLHRLGPQALPAIDELLAGRVAPADPGFSSFAQARDEAEDWFRREQQNWRAWSFRDWRLVRYLDDRKSVGNSE